MRSDKIEKSSWGVDQHPSTELLRQYEEGILSSALSNELERHLMDCELCEDILSGMALADRNRTQQAKNRILQRIRTRLRKSRRRPKPLTGLGDWRVAVGVLMMFCSLGLLLFYHYTRTAADRKAIVRPDEVLPPSPEELLARTIDSALVLEIPAPPPPVPHQLLATGKHQVVSGSVLAPDGQGIAGALVQVKGTSESAVSDGTGNFRLQLAEHAHTHAPVLVVNAVGYSQQEIIISDSTRTVSVQLKTAISPR